MQSTVISLVRGHQCRLTTSQSLLESLLFRPFILLLFYSNLTPLHGGIHLPEETCQSRPSLVTVEQTYKYYPRIVTLHRCGGIADGHSPEVFSCVADGVQNVSLNVVERIGHTVSKGVEQASQPILALSFEDIRTFLAPK